MGNDINSVIAEIKSDYDHSWDLYKMQDGHKSAEEFIDDCNMLLDRIKKSACHLVSDFIEDESTNLPTEDLSHLQMLFADIEGDMTAIAAELGNSRRSYR